MANSLKLYQDSGLTTEQVTPMVASQNKDGSTPPIQFQRWLGSTTAARKFQASSNPGVDAVLLNVINATPLWLALTAYTIDDEVRTTAKNGFKYKATTTGTTGASEPTWPLVVGNTVVDGTVTWENIGPIHESTEVKLAATQGGLSGATPGASLSFGIEVLSEVVNADEFWVEVDDATAEVGTELELSIQTVETDELDV